ncbi:MAG: hypothetical protein A2297_03410 [Elusimicrobia bacterium RIFOXYB2_FULL_48_7]|nr:MAG: hypothetical protein A2297_03410 [Elusimicrobia bacterium RIFOXYB2_FULL_48_7]
MRIVGKRRDDSTPGPTGENLKRGALLNENMARIRQAFGYNGLARIKGAFRYKTHEEADKHLKELMISHIADQKKEKAKNGK